VAFAGAIGKAVNNPAKRTSESSEVIDCLIEFMARDFI